MIEELDEPGFDRLFMSVKTYHNAHFCISRRPRLLLGKISYPTAKAVYAQRLATQEA